MVTHVLFSGPPNYYSEFRQVQCVKTRKPPCPALLSFVFNMVKFTHKKRHTAPDGPGPGRPRAAPRVEPKRHHTHGGLAAELWANDYKSLFELEASERPEIGQMLESVIDEGASTYRQQRRGGEMAVARHQSGVAAAQLSLAAQVRRLANVRDIPLLTAARSLSWLMTMARSIHYQEERKLRRLLDRKTTMRILKSMTKLAPQRSEERRERVYARV